MTTRNKKSTFLCKLLVNIWQQILSHMQIAIFMPFRFSLIWSSRSPRLMKGTSHQTPNTQCTERILDEIAKPINKSYTGWKSMRHHRFNIYFELNSGLKSIEFTRARQLLKPLSAKYEYLHLNFNLIWTIWRRISWHHWQLYDYS